MKFQILLVFALVFPLFGVAQDQSFYTFKEVVNNSSTPTKDQCMTGTCWSYATTSFLESELIRTGKGEHDLSEMYNVRMTYPKKAENYVRYQGKAQFGPGSLSHDVLFALEDYGIVPESVYDGIEYGAERHNHGEMDAVLEAMMEALVDQGPGKLTPSWSNAVEGVLDAYLGAPPEEFSYQGKKYTPSSFRDAMGLKAADYVNLSSFTHHPFYNSFVLEVPDNFSRGSFYNVPLDDLVAMTEKALNAGYTLSWDADVSERGFSFRNGMAVMPEDGVDKSNMFIEETPEMKVTQDNRQAAFDSQATTDDHLMHIVGIANDQFGNPYFIVKNSWGSSNPYGGIQYVSYPYFKMKTISVLVHKNALSKELKSKLSIK
jgi:bleomycin hydrolase